MLKYFRFRATRLATHLHTPSGSIRGDLLQPYGRDSTLAHELEVHRRRPK
jgi:hypothetical protein